MTNTNYQLEQIRKLSFAELEFFLSLYRLRSMTESARIHNLSVPAASRILKKMRMAFDDPLFVRSNPHFLPNNFAHSLAQAVEEILADMHHLLPSRKFDPKTLTQTFRIAAVDNAVLIVLRNFIREFYRLCPHAVLEFQQVDANLFRKMEEGKVDAAILPSSRQIPAKVHERKLYEQYYKLCVRSSHPLVQYYQEHGVVPIREISKYRKIIVTNHQDNEGKGYSLDEINLVGSSHQEVGLTLPYFIPIPSILSNTDLTVVLPDETAKTPLCQTTS